MSLIIIALFCRLPDYVIYLVMGIQLLQCHGQKGYVNKNHTNCKSAKEAFNSPELIHLTSSVVHNFSTFKSFSHKPLYQMEHFIRFLFYFGNSIRPILLSDWPKFQISSSPKPIWWKCYMVVIFLTWPQQCLCLICRFKFQDDHHCRTKPAMVV